MEAQKRAQDNPPLSATRERFEGLLSVVGSEEWLAMTHADMEGALMVTGRELMRTFYEELLALRAAATVVGSDGVERTHVRSRLTSIFGEVEARRDGYSARGTCSLFPVDGTLNLPRESYSLGLRRMVADGKGSSMRRDDLREATRKAAERRQPKLEKRLCKGEKTATRRMAQVAAVYTIEPFVRTREEIVQTLGPAPAEATPQKRPPPQDKRVGKGKKLKVTSIVDIIHVVEYLWDAARVFQGEGTPEAEKSERLLRVLQGKASQVAAAERRRPIDGFARYLLKYAKHLRYDEYLAAGYPIATGASEGVCRYLVKDHVDTTGPRWSLAGAEAGLRVRAPRASGDFDDYWAFHVAREHARNHLNSCANHALPASQPASHGRSKPNLRVVS